MLPMRTTSIALGLIVALSFAAAPATKPAKAPAAKPVAKAAGATMPEIPAECPKLAFQAKKGAPGWVVDYLERQQKAREQQFRELPEHIRKSEAQLEVLKKSPINPDLKTPSMRSEKGSVFRTVADRSAAVAAHKAGLEGRYADAAKLLDVTTIPNMTREGQELKDWVEPVK